MERETCILIGALIHFREIHLEALRLFHFNIDKKGKGRGKEMKKNAENKEVKVLEAGNGKEKKGDA